MNWGFWLLLILMVFVIVLILLLVIPIRLEVEYRWVHNRNVLSMHARVLGIRFSLPAPELESESDSTNKPSLGRRLFRIIRQEYADIHEQIEKMLKAVHVTQLQWTTRFGTGEAVSTGSGAGMVWGIKWSLLALVSRYLTMQSKPDVSVEPLFQQETLETNIRFAVTVQIAKLLWRAMPLMRSILPRLAGIVIVFFFNS